MTDNTPNTNAEDQLDPTDLVTGLTAHELITKLQKLHPDTLITTTTWDPDWGTSYRWTIHNIQPDGTLIKGDILSTQDEPHLDAMIDGQEN